MAFLSSLGLISVYSWHTEQDVNKITLTASILTSQEL